MKPILILILVAASSLTLSSAEPLTATELSKHFGVFHWKTTVDLAPGSFSIYLSEITNGKVGPTHLGAMVGPEGAGGQTLVVMASNETDGTHLSFSIGGASMSNIQVEDKPKISFPHCSGLPEKIKAGQYAVGGEYFLKEGVAVMTSDFKDVKKGLLLTVLLK